MITVLCSFSGSINAQCPTPDPDLTFTMNTTYTTWDYSGGDGKSNWIIPGGITVSILNCTAQFIKDVSITVKPGGALVLENCTLTTGGTCNKWNGIVVEGDATTSQFYNDGSIIYNAHGYVKLKSGVLIKKAITGIHSTEGGIIETSDSRNVAPTIRSKFLNCWESIRMEVTPCYAPDPVNDPYNQVWSPKNDNALMQCASLIQDCDFVWTSIHPSQGASHYNFMNHIYLGYIMGLEITGCDFSNNDNTSFSEPHHRGNGIYSHNSSFWVRKSGDGSTLDDNDCPEFNGDPCTFKQLSVGIEWNGVQDGLVYCDLSCEEFENDGVIESEYETLNVTECEFENCWVSIGVQYDGQDILIAKNTFIFNEEVTPGGGYWSNISESDFLQRHIHLEDVFDFTIYENTFTNSTLDYYHALYISNYSCGGTSLIQHNDFNGSASLLDNNTVAINLRDNTTVDGTSNDDLLILCNDINQFETGILIDAGISLLDQEAGIGSEDDAKNTFTNVANDKHIVNNGASFKYYWNEQKPQVNDVLLVDRKSGNSHEVCELTCDGWPTVSVEETELISLLVDVYPNPSSGSLNIESYGKEIESIAVFNLSGVMVYQKTQLNASNINLNHLPDGMYLMQVKVDDQLSNHRIIITK